MPCARTHIMQRARCRQSSLGKLKVQGKPKCGFRQVARKQAPGSRFVYEHAGCAQARHIRRTAAEHGDAYLCLQQFHLFGHRFG